LSTKSEGWKGQNLPGYLDIGRHHKGNNSTTKYNTIHDYATHAKRSLLSPYPTKLKLLEFHQITLINRGMIDHLGIEEPEIEH
jgi:hypothetical protein